MNVCVDNQDTYFYLNIVDKHKEKIMQETYLFDSQKVQLGIFPNSHIAGHKDQERNVHFSQTFGPPKVLDLDVKRTTKPLASRYFDYKTGKSLGIYCGRKVIDRRFVYVPKNKAEAKNFIRDGSTVDLTHSQRFSSFLYGGGYDDGAWPSVVFKLKKPIKVNGQVYYYILGSAGNHREESLDELGAEFWMYDIYEEMDSSEWVLDDSTIQDNGRLQVPTLDLTKNAVENKVTEMVTGGRWKGLSGDDLLAEIKAYLQFTVPNLHHNSRAAIARNSMRKTETTDWLNYTPEEAESFVDTHTDLKHSFEFDTKRDMYGCLIMDGYFDKRLFQSLLKFGETGKETYATAYGKQPKIKKGDNRSIRQIKNGNFNDIEMKVETAFDRVFAFKKKHGRYPKLGTIENLLPQDRKTENLTEVIKK